MLAADDITLTIGGEAMLLRPSLRAAIRLERRFGFQRLIEGASTSLTVQSEILTECGAPGDIHFGLAFGEAMQHVAVACMSLLVELYALDAEPSEPSAPAGPLVTHAEHLAHLYRMATGWIGWTPEAALDATPAEIIEAAKGRQELIGDILKAVFGSSDDTPPSSPPAAANHNFKSEDFLARANAARDGDARAKLAGLGKVA